MGASKSIGGPAQLVLKKNSPAPYDGVLVPYDLFREYEINEMASNVVRQDLEECSRQIGKQTLDAGVFLSPLWFIGGFVVGALATGALR